MGRSVRRSDGGQIGRCVVCSAVRFRGCRGPSRMARGAGPPAQLHRRKGGCSTRSKPGSHWQNSVRRAHAWRRGEKCGGRHLRYSWCGEVRRDSFGNVEGPSLSAHSPRRRGGGGAMRGLRGCGVMRGLRRRATPSKRFCFQQLVACSSIACYLLACLLSFAQTAKHGASNALQSCRGPTRGPNNKTMVICLRRILCHLMQ